MLTPNNKNENNSQCKKNTIIKSIWFGSLFAIIIIFLVYIISVIEMIGFKRRDIFTDKISFDDMAIVLIISIFFFTISSFILNSIIKTYDCE